MNEQPDNVVFSIRVTGVRTGTVQSLSNVVRQVAFVVSGSVGSSTFELPQTVDLGDPNPSTFIDFSQVTEADVSAWIESSFQNMEGVKAHIRTVVLRMAAEAALENKPLPWAPQQPSTPVNNE